MAILRQPIRGRCLPSCWYGNTSGGACSTVVCPRPLLVFLSSSQDALAVDFAGGGKRGLGCPGSDSFITIVNGSRITIDVWRAYALGFWSSSVALAVYASIGAANPADGVALSVRVNPTQLSGACPDVGGIPTIATIRGEACPSTQIASITVFDDGTYACAVN